MHELDPDELEQVAGGQWKQTYKKKSKEKDVCPEDLEGNHEWVKYAHTEDEWFGWIKDGGLWSVGTDYYRCVKCGKTKKS